MIVQPVVEPMEHYTALVDTCPAHVRSPGVPGLRLQPDLDQLHGAGDGELHGAARHTRQVHAGQVVGGQLGRQVLIMIRLIMLS